MRQGHFVKTDCYENYSVFVLQKFKVFANFFAASKASLCTLYYIEITKNFGPRTGTNDLVQECAEKYAVGWALSQVEGQKGRQSATPVYL